MDWSLRRSWRAVAAAVVLPADFARRGCAAGGHPARCAQPPRKCGQRARFALPPGPSPSRWNKTSNQSVHRRYSSRPPASSATSTSQARPGSRNITQAEHCSSTTLSDKSCRRLRWWQWLRRCWRIRMSPNWSSLLRRTGCWPSTVALSGRSCRRIQTRAPLPRSCLLLPDIS